MRLLFPALSQYLTIPVSTSIALGCLIVAIIILISSFVVLFRARKNLQQSEKAMHQAQEMKIVWEGEKHRFSQPTLMMPEDYYRGYEKVS